MHCLPDEWPVPSTGMSTGSPSGMSTGSTGSTSQLGKKKNHVTQLRSFLSRDQSPDSQPCGSSAEGVESSCAEGQILGAQHLRFVPRPAPHQSCERGLLALMMVCLSSLICKTEKQIIVPTSKRCGEDYIILYYICILYYVVFSVCQRSMEYRKCLSIAVMLRQCPSSL